MIVKNNMPVVGTLNYKVNGAPKKIKIGGGAQIDLPGLIHESQVLNFQDILTGRYTLVETKIINQPVIKEPVIEKTEKIEIETVLAEEESALKKAKKEAKIYTSESKKNKKLNKKK